MNGRVPPMRPGQSALLSGDYGYGKSTLLKAWAFAIGRGAFWAATPVPGQPVEFSDFAVVVRSAGEMQRAAKTAPFVVWPCPDPLLGVEEMRHQFDEFNRVALTFYRALIGYDELQHVLGDSKRLIDAPRHFQSMVETGHKAGRELAKVYVAHRQAQIPLALAGGAYRVAFKPFPGDERAIDSVFGRGAYARMMASFRRGDFAFWSQRTGTLMPCRLDLATRPYATLARKPGVQGVQE
jgi:hypothetical protein